MTICPRHEDGSLRGVGLDDGMRATTANNWLLGGDEPHAT